MIAGVVLMSLFLIPVIIPCIAICYSFCYSFICFNGREPSQDSEYDLVFMMDIAKDQQTVLKMAICRPFFKKFSKKS